MFHLFFLELIYSVKKEAELPVGYGSTFSSPYPKECGPLGADELLSYSSVQLANLMQRVPW